MAGCKRTKMKSGNRKDRHCWVWDGGTMCWGRFCVRFAKVGNGVWFVVYLLGGWVDEWG